MIMTHATSQSNTRACQWRFYQVQRGDTLQAVAMLAHKMLSSREPMPVPLVIIAEDQDSCQIIAEGLGQGAHYIPAKIWDMPLPAEDRNVSAPMPPVIIVAVDKMTSDVWTQLVTQFAKDYKLDQPVAPMTLWVNLRQSQTPSWPDDSVPEMNCVLFDARIPNALTAAREWWKVLKKAPAAEGQQGQELSFWQQNDRGQWSQAA